MIELSHFNQSHIHDTNIYFRKIQMIVFQHIRLFENMLKLKYDVDRFNVMLTNIIF